jgi:hypothetical protein
MEPLTITITSEDELVGMLRGRGLGLSVEIQNLVGSELDDVVINAALGADGERIEDIRHVVEQMEVARDALIAVHGGHGD